MHRADAKRVLALIILGSVVLIFRTSHDNPLAFVLATLAVIAFWGLHSLQISRFNVRAFLLILLLFGVPFVLLRQLPIFSTNEATTGPWTEDSFNPALMGVIRPTHEIALQVYFDHHPSTDERYFKTATLEKTGDGLHYQERMAILDEAAMPLAKRWTEQNLKTLNIEKKIERVESFFQAQLQYSMQPGQLQSSHPFDEFLFERKLGYCEHFAAGLATLLKLSGTRARVVVGFEGGSWNPLTEELTFDMSDSHAWVEFLDPAQKKWIKEDPTAWIRTSQGRNTERVSRSLSSGFLFVICLLLGLIVFALIQSKNNDPRKVLARKIERAERRLRISGRGLTFSERMIQLTKSNPKTAAQILATLQLYQQCYFAGEPSKESLSQLSRSIRRSFRSFVVF